MSSAFPTVVGATGVTNIQNVQVVLGEEQVVDYAVDISSVAAGTFVSAALSPGDVSSSFDHIIVLGYAARAYVLSPPADILIDGAFADWNGKATADSDTFTLANPNIDIAAVGAVNNTESASFYVSVVGDMCSGSAIPIILAKPTGGGGGVIIPSRKTGEDLLRVYIDSDMSVSTGYNVALSTEFIGADYKVEVHGLEGKVVSKQLMQYSGGQWVVMQGAQVDAANDAKKLEVAVMASAIGSSSIDFIVETTDWRARTDLATAVPLGTRSMTGPMASGISPEGWIIDGPTTSSSATAMSYQRKLFYDGTNFWSFYWDGVNTVYKYSTDGGQTWTLGTSVFKTTGINEVSLWYHSASNTVYAVGDAGTASLNVYLQRGTVDPAMHTISWPDPDRMLPASANVLGGKNAYISRDASGYLWVMSSNCTNPASPVRYDLSVFRSSAVDSITSWVYSGNNLSADSNQPVLKGSVVPTGTGSDVWAVYGYEGNVAARQYTGTWSTEELVFDIALAGPNDDNPGNTDVAPPSCLVDSNGVLHVLYGNGHEQSSVSKPRIFYAYNTGSAWSADPDIQLDSASSQEGNHRPTISLDSQTGNVYAFWIETDNGDLGLTIMGMKNVSGTWTSLTIGGQTAGEKRYLTSIYSAPGENYICWQWTQNTTAPIQVIFDKIPEFSDAVVPVFISLLILVAFMRRDRARRTKKG